MLPLLLAVSLAWASEKGPVRETPLESCRAMAEHRERVLPAAAPGTLDRVAVVVGVGCYWEAEAFGSLLAPPNDAGEVAELLDRAGFELALLTGWVTGDEVRETLGQALDLVSDDGILLLYWSGHGAIDRPQRLPERHLVTSDTTLPWISLTALATDELEGILGDARAARRVLVVDSCHAGTLVSKAAPVTEHDEGTGEPAGTRAEPADLRLYASDFGRPAFEESDPDDARFGHSLYTWHLVRAFDSAEADMDGDGVVGLWEGHEHAARQVRDATAGVQNPRMEASSPDNIQLLPAAAAGTPSSAVVVHLGQLGTHVELRLDGEQTSFGAVPPGRHRVEVHRLEPGADPSSPVAARLLWRRRVELAPGEWLAVDRLVAARDRRWLASLGFAWSTAQLEQAQPSRSVLASGWLLPADPYGLRPALGLNARAGVDTLYVEQERQPSGGLGARAGLLWSAGLAPSVAIGPTLDISWLARIERHSDGVEVKERLRSAPVAGVGLHLHGALHGWLLAADGGVGVLPYGVADGAGVGWGQRAEVAVGIGRAW